MPYYKVTWHDERVVKADNAMDANQKAWEVDSIDYRVEVLADDDPLALEAADEDAIEAEMVAEAQALLAAQLRDERNDALYEKADANPGLSWQELEADDDPVTYVDAEGTYQAEREPVAFVEDPANPFDVVAVYDDDAEYLEAGEVPQSEWPKSWQELESQNLPQGSNE